MSVDLSKTDAMIITKCLDGGYTVRTHVDFTRGEYSALLYACTTITEALAYIKKKLGQ